MCISFCILYSVPVVYVTVPLPIPQCFDYYSYIISLNIRQSYSSNFSLLFKTALAILGFLPFHINLSISLSTVTKWSCWNFDRHCVTSIDKCRENWYLYYMQTSNSCTSLHLLRSLVLLIKFKKISAYRSCTCFVRFISKYFILGGININDILYLILNSQCTFYMLDRVLQPKDGHKSEKNLLSTFGCFFQYSILE